MKAQRYRVERLTRGHSRAAFSCGEDSLDAYLRERARRDADRHVATVFILHDPQADRVAGYYTLSASSVLLAELPLEMQRTLPRYPQAPVVLLGRLGIDRDYQGQDLGEALLFDALHVRARAFYEQYGFQRFPDNAYRLLMPMQTITQLLAEDEA